MKKITYLIVFGFTAIALGVTNVTFTVTKKKGPDGKDATYWVVEPETVAAGEKIHIKAVHNLEGGFDYHGLFIPELKVNMTVNRGKPEEQDVTVPEKFAPADPAKPTILKAGCQFHSTHQPAVLMVGAPAKVASKK